METNSLKTEIDSMEVFINFIGGLYEDYFYEKYNCKSEIFFTKGGCLILAKVLKHFFNEDIKIMYNNDKIHVMIKYNNKLYDINGVHDDNSYIELSEMELLECEDRNMSEGGQMVYSTLIEEIPKCNMESTIENIKIYKKTIY